MSTVYHPRVAPDGPHEQEQQGYAIPKTSYLRKQKMCHSSFDALTQIFNKLLIKLPVLNRHVPEAHQMTLKHIH